MNTWVFILTIILSDGSQQTVAQNVLAYKSYQACELDKQFFVEEVKSWSAPPGVTISVKTTACVPALKSTT